MENCPKLGGHANSGVGDFRLNRMPLALLINLDKDHDRLKSSVEEFSKLGMTFTRITATTSERLENPSSFDFMRSVEACWASHMSALQVLVQSGSSFALVFEDDFLVKNENKFKRTLNALENYEFDLIQLGYLSLGFKNRCIILIENTQTLLLRLFLILGKLGLPVFRKNMERRRINLIHNTPRHFVPNSFQPGTHAYIISRSLAERILIEHKTFLLPADGFFNALASAGGIVSFRVAKSLVKQKNFTGSMRTSKSSE
jgi:GR25 family glycosyltransferase involved in LPS biosynthesis